MGDMVRLAYGHNVLERTVAIMTEVDPGWKLPDAFFPAQMEAVERGSKPCGMTMEGKIDANVGAEPQEVPALGGIEAAQGLSPTPFLHDQYLSAAISMHTDRDM